MEVRFNRNHAKWFVSPVLRAIRRYALIEPGERVCVGLSGGKDSVTLLYILSYLRRYSRLGFELSALHVRVAAEYDTTPLADYCRELEVPYLETALEMLRRDVRPKVCSICARLKRGAAARALTPHGIRKLAYGHHADDVAETLLLNILQNKKLGSFSPRVSVEGAPLILIRPMVYLEERTVAAIHRHLGLPHLDMPCPYARHNLRQRYKTSLQYLAVSLGIRSVSRHVVDALERVDAADLWHPLRAGRRL